MSAKNLEIYRSSIKDIDAKRVKELLSIHHFNDPTFSANQIGKAIINLTAAATGADDETVDREELQYSVYVLESVFDFFTDLMHEPKGNVN